MSVSEDKLTPSFSWRIRVSGGTFPSAAHHTDMDRSPAANPLCTELQRIVRIRLKFSFQISLSPNEDMKVLQGCYNLSSTVHATVYQTGYQPPPRVRFLGIYRLSITLFSGEKLGDLSLDLCYPGAIMWSLIGWRRRLWGSLGRWDALPKSICVSLCLWHALLLSVRGTCARLYNGARPSPKFCSETRNNKRISWLALQKCHFPPDVTVWNLCLDATAQI